MTPNRDISNMWDPTRLQNTSISAAKVPHEAPPYSGLAVEASLAAECSGNAYYLQTSATRRLSTGSRVT